MTKISADLQKKLKSARHLKGSGRDWAYWVEQRRLLTERVLADAGFDLNKLKTLNDKIEKEKENSNDEDD